MMYMVAAGVSQTEIARQFGYTDCRLSIIINSPAFITECDKIKAQAEGLMLEKLTDFESKLKLLAPDAVDLLACVMHNNIENASGERIDVGVRTRVDAAKSVLDLTAKNHAAELRAAAITNGDGEETWQGDFATFAKSALKEALKERIVEKEQEENNTLDMSAEEITQELLPASCG